MFYDDLLFYYVALNRIQCNVIGFVCVSQFLKGSNGLIMRGKKKNVLNGNKVPLFHLDELSKYYFSRSFVAREIKNLEFISMK